MSSALASPLDLRALPIEELSTAERTLLLTPQQRSELLEEMTDEDVAALPFDWSFWCRPDQRPPPGDAWRLWVLIEGRGAGKTRAGAEWVRAKVKHWQPRGGEGMLVGATAADVRDLMVEGPSGILEISPPAERPHYEPSKRLLTWPNGAVARCRSAEDPEGLRGPSLDWAWCDELAKWRYLIETWDNLRFALREGTNPQTVVTTTPRPLPLLRQIIAGRYPGTVIAPRVSTYRNAVNLARPYLEEMVATHEGTRRGRQELHAELLEDVEGALWTLAMIEADRLVGGLDTSGLWVPPALPVIRRTAIGVDPSGTKTGDECGIVVVGIDGRKPAHAYVLDDRSVRGSPATWGEAAVRAYVDASADVMVAETNFGAEMVEHVIRTVPAKGDYPSGDAVRFRAVHASKGKQVRAEPVVGLYEQHRVHHVGHFADLESQMTMWVPGESTTSPDRVDALVWAITDLAVLHRMGTARTTGAMVAAARLP